MKREQLQAFGIPADKIKDFLGIYWEDVHKQAQRRASRQPDTVRDTRQAIAAMLGLIDDPKRLQMILRHVNRHYFEHTQNQPQPEEKQTEAKKANGFPENQTDTEAAHSGTKGTSVQFVQQNEQEAKQTTNNQEQPQTAAKGVAECP